MPVTYRFKRGGGLKEDLYDGAADVGRVMAVVNLIGGVLMSIIMLSIGIYLLVSPQKYSRATRASVTASECTRVDQGGNKGSRYDCEVTLVYQDDTGKEFTNKTIVSSASRVVAGSLQSVRYDPTAPEDVTTNWVSRRLVGWILTGIAVLVGLGSGLSYWIAQRSKVMAAVIGANTVQNAVFAAVQDG